MEKTLRRILPGLLGLLACSWTGPAFAAPATIYRSTIRLKHWDYEPYLRQFSPGDKYYPYHQLSQLPGSGTYRDFPTVELENDFIRVTVLPWNAGHILQLINKTTGNNEYYANPEGFKTTRGGRLGWWLVPGGTEWMVPFDEHAPTFYQPFDDYTGPGAEPDGIRIEDYDGGVRLTMVFDEASWSAGIGSPVTRWRTEIQVEVPDNEALYREHIRVANHAAGTQDLMFWENTQLGPGPGNLTITPGAQRNLNIQLVYPGNVHHLYDHNAMEPWLAGPDPWGKYTWKRHSNTLNPYPQKWVSNPSVIRAANLNLSLLRNWYEEALNAMGAFVPAGFGAGYAGVYNLDADEGVAKTFPEVIVTSPQRVETGTKFWNFGVYGAASSYQFSDGTNVFIELMGGPCRVFEEWGVYPHPTGEKDRIPVPAGGELAWTNTFCAPHGIGGFTWADDRAVLNLVGPSAAVRGEPASFELGVFTVSPQSGGTATLDIGGRTIHESTGVHTAPNASPGPFHYLGDILIPTDTPSGPQVLSLTYRFPDGSTASCSEPVTVQDRASFAEHFEVMPEWSDSLFSTTGPTAFWGIGTDGAAGKSLRALSASPGVDSRILIYRINSGLEGNLQVMARCPSGTGLHYIARAAYRLATGRDEICGPGLADPGAGWRDIVRFQWNFTDGNGDQWRAYSVPVTAGPNDRYLAIGFELGSTDTGRPDVGWDELTFTSEIGGTLLKVY